MNVEIRCPTVLSVAGSDSGGGAGIQADLKTFFALQCHGTTALTCVTAQNPDGVFAVSGISDQLVTAQIHAVASAFPVAAVKTGMLYAADTVHAVCEALEQLSLPCVVVDPVMVATSGAVLLCEEAMTAVRERLLPLAKVTTPNIPEAEQLLGAPIGTGSDMPDAARELASRFGVSCVLKGGHLGKAGAPVLDVLYHEGRLWTFETPYIEAVETHGTGCTFSAALAAYLALGVNLPDAARNAQAFVSSALHAPMNTGRHRPLGIMAAGCASRGGPRRSM